MEEKPLVTMNGECFDAEFQGEERDGRRPGTVHLFRLRDMRSGRGELLVSLFTSEQLKLLNPNYRTRIESVRINVIRRAFDTGKLNFGTPRDEHIYHSLDLNDSDFQPLPLVADADIRQFMAHKAYWLCYMHPVYQPNEPIGFDTPEDRDYLGAGEADIVRNITRLKNQGLLDKVMAGHGRPTEALISAYEAKLHSTSSTETLATLADIENGQPVTHKGLAVFISHSSIDAALAEALIDLLKSALGIRAEQIRCSSVDGYRLPVGVNTEGKLREEVNAATVVVGLITPNSLKSPYVMFELGARWGANRFLAPLPAGVERTNSAAR